MRIGILTYGLDRPLTGISRYTVEIVKALANQAQAPDITLLHAGDLGSLAKQTPFATVRLAGCRLLPSLMTLGQTLLPALVRRLRLDIIHDPTGVTPLGAIDRRTKRVVTVNDVFAHSIPKHSSRLDTIIYTHWLPRILPRVNAIITPSQQSRRDILTYLKLEDRQINVIPHGIAAQFKRRSEQATKRFLQQQFGLSAPYLLYVGGLTKRKNIAGALKAFAMARHAFPELRFVIVGPNLWQQPPLAALVTQLDIAERVQVLGSVSDQALTYLYSGARAFVFPSFYEGFGLPPLEAMACGTPVITSNNASLPEFVAGAALLVDPHDSEAIAAAMCQLLRSPALAAQLAQRGLHRAQQFTWARTAQRTLDVYRQVVDES